MSSTISIVIPCYNEAGNLIPLLNRVTLTCQSYKYEIVVVDDGSTDSSPSELKLLAEKVKHLKVISLKRNFGQTAALSAGIDNSNGDIIIPLDADGQNDPEDIPRLIEKLNEGFDVVSGWRKDRKDTFITRKLPSILANKLISIVTGVHLHDYGCSLKAYKRKTITGVQLYGEMHRFLPAWCVWQGGKVAEIPVRHHPRTRGISKYGIFRTFKVIIDLITIKFFSGYLSKPSHLFSGTGLFFIFMGFCSASFAIFDKFGPDKFTKFRIPLLLLAIFFGLGAISLILMGLLAELLVRLYFQVRNQKPYLLADE
ncbi:MAG: Dodecaprenyl-phosphate galacturonate synthase [Elusimicrobia bacterium]|nr:Dodecaprenyl-phosphate galacturonate synthase [Elusimicrobiota bacterium]